MNVSLFYCLFVLDAVILGFFAVAMDALVGNSIYTFSSIRFQFSEQNKPKTTEHSLILYRFIKYLHFLFLGISFCLSDFPVNSWINSDQFLQNYYKFLHKSKNDHRFRVEEMQHVTDAFF